MASVSASVARQTLPAQLDLVEAGEEVAITRHGRVVAILIRPDMLWSRRASAAWARAEQVGELLESARRQPLRAPAVDPERAEELVAGIARDRSV